MSLIRKYAAPLAALAALLMAVAAPYMIPENPDSAVMRSGSLGLILLCAAAFPVRRAYMRANRRTLLVSLGLCWLFALALSVGSELFIYDGLLRGLGSLVRRMAVPVLAAPLLGGLIAAFLSSPPAARGKALRIPAWGYALAIFLCWLPLLLAYFPGMLNYDFLGEYRQHVDGSYTNLHPLLHSALINGVITLGEMLHSRTFGVLLYSLLQMGLFALALGYSCSFVQKRGAGAWALLPAGLYALHPVFSVMSLSLTKDTLFTAAVLSLSLFTWEMIESPEAFFARRSRLALYVLCTVGTALLRSNGVAALVLLLPGAFVAVRGMKKHAVALCAAAAAACLLVNGAFTLALSPQTLPSFQFYSLPAQQLVRAYNSGAMSEEDRAELRSWYTDEEGLKVFPHLADPAKGYLNRERIQSEGEQFMALWKKNLPRHVHEYIEALLMLNVGSWYADDLSHSTIYPDVSWNDKGYLQTQEYDMTAYDIHTTSFLPAVQALFERICRRNAYQEYPVIAQLFAAATPFWAMMLAVAALIARRNTRFLPAALGVLGLWLSYLFGACTLPRYMLPLFALAPALLLAARFTAKEDA